MASALDILNEWMSENEEKQIFYRSKPTLIRRWLNQGQLRYVDKSEILQSVWTPTVTGSGNIALPSDFLREYPDRVLNTTSLPPLCKIRYWDAINIVWSTTTHYSVYNGKLYLWAAAAMNPTIAYIKKPTLITDETTADLEIPSEFHHNIILYLDIMWERKMEKISILDEQKLLSLFDEKAQNDGNVKDRRQSNSVSLRPSRF